MIIQCDIDDTLYNGNALFSRLLQEANIDYPKNPYQWLSHNDTKRFDGSSVTVQELKTIFRKAHSQEYVSQQIPYSNAAKVLSGIQKEFDFVDVFYVSDRHPQSNGTLRQWLTKHRFLTEQEGHKVITVKDKRQWMRINKPEIVIDDRVRTIWFSRHELNATVFSLKHNHNMNLINEIDNVYIENDWLHIGEKLATILKNESNTRR